MFNIGMIAPGRSMPLVALTDAPLYFRETETYFRYEMALWADGRLSRVTHLAGNEFTPGQWYALGQTAGVGSLYEYRTEIVSGSALNFGGTSGAWVGIGASNKTIRWHNNGGRMRLSIRRIGQTAPEASALFWTDGYSP